MTTEEKLLKIGKLKKQVDKLQLSNKKWDQHFLEKIKVDFTFTSNKIEGSTLTHGQTLQIIKEFVTPQNTSYAYVIDVVNHKAVLDIIFDNYDTQELTEQNIKSLHKELMKHPAQWTDGIHYDPGRYKILDNHTYRSNGKAHHYIDPKSVPNAMKKLLTETNSALAAHTEKNSYAQVLQIASNFHYQFLNIIHPFGDGNGRIARIFMNLILLKCGLPPIFIKEVDKHEYLNCFLEEENKTGAMLNFMADRLIESLMDKKKALSKSIT